jgi:hypothetical protein
MAQNKQRKSEAQKNFEEAENAGRFAGNDPDALASKEQARENIRQDTDANQDERNNKDNQAKNRQGDNQSQDGKGEGQNVNDDEGRLPEPGEPDHARNKASKDGVDQSRH